jgi:hypothetical protein
LIAEDLPEALPAVYSGLVAQIEARKGTRGEHAGALA